jgi:copper chaperone
VTEAVHTLDPDAKVEVDLPTQTVRVEGGAAVEATVAAIREEGYTVQVQEA